MEPSASNLHEHGGGSRLHHHSNRHCHCLPVQVQPALQAQLSGGAGEALLRAAVLGLADSLPPAAVPR